MNNPFDYFQEIYCINLDHRADRWEQSQQEFENVGILSRVQRFSAIKHEDGRVGVIKSNLEIVKEAKRRKLENVLIFEDDVQFVGPNPVESLRRALSQLKIPWQLFYLGANTHTKLIKLTPNLIYLKDAFAVHSMAYHQTLYDKFINYAEPLQAITNPGQILDVWLAREVQAKQIALMVNPLLTTQRESYSDIEGKLVNYGFIEERFKNNIKWWILSSLVKIEPRN